MKLKDEMLKEICEELVEYIDGFATIEDLMTDELNEKMYKYGITLEEIEEYLLHMEEW